VARLTAEPHEQRLATLAKALGHPTRVRLVRILAERGACVTGQLVEALPLAQSTVSEHLKILKDAGIVQGDLDTDRPHYCLDPRVLSELGDAVAALTEPTATSCR
jgi:ArsR family transcriptional regulator